MKLTEYISMSKLSYIHYVSVNIIVCMAQSIFDSLWNVKKKTGKHPPSPMKDISLHSFDVVVPMLYKSATKSSSKFQLIFQNKYTHWMTSQPIFECIVP